MDIEMSGVSARHPYERLSSSAFRENDPEESADLGLGLPGEPRASHVTAETFYYTSKIRNPFKKLSRWAATVLFTGLIALTLGLFEKKGNFTSHWKIAFNTIITGLILGWGLNLFEACKESARDGRWRILAKEPHTKREADLILGIENLLTVVALGWESSRTRLCCAVWLLFNLGLQISVAAISLTFSVDDGKDYNDTYNKIGTVTAANLTTYFSGNHAVAFEDYQALAHSWGLNTKSQPCEEYEDIAQVYRSRNNPPYFCRRTAGKQEFAYRFREYNVKDVERIYPYFTNRLITASSGVCLEYTALSNSTGYDEMDGIQPSYNFTYSNSTYTSTISIPVSSEGWSATVYLYPGPDLPQFTEVNSCGDRCLWIWAQRTSIPGNNASSFFQCPITISEVSNATTDLHDIPDSVARTAAASIALSGRWTGTIENKIWKQYQYMAWNTPWETHGLDDDQAGANMAEFALGSLATMVEVNPTIQISGHVPYLGSRLNIYHHWGPVLAFLIVIPVAHFVLLFATVFYTRKVVVADDSFISIARLLNDTERHTQGEGQATEETALNSDGIVYGPLSMADGNYVMSIGENVKCLRQWKGRRHPHGNYLRLIEKVAF